MPRVLTSSPGNPLGAHCLSSLSPESGLPLEAPSGPVFHPGVWSPQAGGEAGLLAEGRGKGGLGRGEWCKNQDGPVR